MTQAVESAKLNRTKKQIVCGKEFKGQPFIPKPSEIIFKDFEVGKSMVLTIT